MIIGTAGHIDHGKTALVKALTGVDADRLAEEKARGITIDLGFAYADLGRPEALETASGRITGFVDVPGHERLIRTMLAGAGGIDFALLVVASDDGPMPQTREHLAILELLGLRRGIVALTKADLAGPDHRSEVTAQIRAMLAGSGLAESPVIAVSAQSGEGIAELRHALALAEEAATPRAAQGPFRLAVDRSFTIAGAGTVVTGMVLSGRVRTGDEVIISPQGLVARVRGIHAQNRKADEGQAGQRCALNLAGEGVGKDSIHRGDLVLAPELHAPTARIDALLRVLPSESKAITTWLPVHLHSHSVEVPARVVPLEGDLPPGGEGLVQLVLERPIAATAGDAFVLRDASATRSIGGGRFIDLRPPARKRGTAGRLAMLGAMGQTASDEALAAMLALAPVERAGFLRDRALDAAGWLPPQGATEIGGLLLSAGQQQELGMGLAQQLADFHAENPDAPGMAREKLRLLLQPRLPKDEFLAFLRKASESALVVLDGAFLRLPGHEVRLAPEDEALFGQILPQLLGGMRFRPPRVRDFAASLGVDERQIRRVLKLTQKMGQTDQIAHDHFFAREVTREMAGLMREVAAQSPDGWFTAAPFRDRMDNGRKVAIQILDFFDRLGLTLRRGDLRRLNPHRQDLFG